MKRPPPSGDGDPVTSGSKRRRRISISEDDDSSRPPLTPGFSDPPPMHKIYNSSCRKEKPDELFRKDLISAMKLPDNEQLDESEFWDVSDSWKQEWERGVQVPVNSKHVPNANVRIIREKNKSSNLKLPKKFMRTSEDAFFSNDHHVLVDTAAKAENVCKYDMDDMDSEWLKIFNEKREEFGLSLVNEDTMERILEDFETQCSNRFQDALKTEKGLGIEYDEDVICDVCRSPDCEEGNEMVFCDSCNICVHQACYGIMAIPEGSWICRPCALNLKPSCALCPNTGGAMKSTSNGDKWAHVSCALWVPEVSIGSPEKMEPIQKISNVPASRWALICSLCRDRVGACIQCSVKQCKVAYHVTCAFENGLEMEMKTTALESSEQGVKMQSYCTKHSKTENAGEKSPVLKSTRKGRKKKEEESKDPKSEVDEHNARLQKIRSLEAQFHKYVRAKDTSDLHNVELQVVEFLYYYWVLKRRAKFNKPLLITKCDEANLLIKQHENLLYSRLKMFVHLRQDLERVRNLCYMVSRREKMFRSYLRIKNDIFDKQNEILTNKSYQMTPTEVDEVLKARSGTSLFDKFYGIDVEEEKKEETAPKTPVKQPNPYAKSYTNNVHTRARRRTTSQNMNDSATENCDSESNEMPTLVKCKSEENLSSNDTKKPVATNFTHSPFVVKIESKQQKEDSKANVKPELESLTQNNISEKLRDLAEEENLKFESAELEMPKISSELPNIKLKKHIPIETSNSKNSLCLSDKENINALNPIKIKKTRSQTGLPDFKSNSISDLSKLDIFDDEITLNGNDVGNPDVKKNGFRLDRRSTRYQMRSRRNSHEVPESEDVTPKTVDSMEMPIDIACQNEDANSPSGSAEKPDSESPKLDPPSVENTPSDPPRRRRGRPRKIVQEVATIPPEAADVPNESADQTNCDQELSDSGDSPPGFRRSLRHSREARRPPELKPKGRRSAGKPDDTAAPLKEANILTNERTLSDWDDSQPPRLEEQQPNATRIIIRLRKDPNRELWKNDSSSSSDVPVAFRIVRNDLDVDCDIIPQNEMEEETRHRYPMRERASTKGKS